ncbi:MAG: ectoine/hydroxyectoine ABC transporter substrate-binding protein EhuB [Desemzia incerta]
MKYAFAKIGKSIIALLIAVIFLASCSNETDEQTTLNKVRDQGYVVVGFANEKPYAYQTADGELTGEAVEIARVILERLGIEEMRGVLTEFSSLVPGLQAGRFDMVTAGMFITPQRAEEESVQFANPEYKIGQAIAVQKGNPLDLHSYQDIGENSEATIAIVGGAIEYQYAIEAGISEDQIVTVPDMPSALSALLSGRVDAITATGPSLQATLDTANNDNIERVEEFEQPVVDGESVEGYGATVFRSEDQAFIDAFNAELEKLKESGELLEIIEPFGFTEKELPGDVTVEDVLE